MEEADTMMKTAHTAAAGIPMVIIAITVMIIFNRGRKYYVYN